MVMQKNRLFREATQIAKQEAHKALYEINKWIQGDWIPVWSDVYNMTHIFDAGNVILLGNIKSIGIYIIRYIPTGDIMYIGQGLVWKRKRVHAWTFNELLKSGSMEKLRLDRPRIKSSLSECGEKMFKYDRKLKNWSFECCVVDSKSLAKYMEDVWKESIKAPFNVKGWDLT